MEHGELTRSASVGPERTRRAVLALWSIPGVGPVGLERLSERTGDVGALLDVPVEDWLGDIAATMSRAVCERLKEVGRLAFVAEVVLERANDAEIAIAYPGDASYPERLIGIPQQPPVLFVKGSVSSRPRRRVAMVGSRHPDGQFLDRARGFAADLARMGLGVISGAADGVDQACHRGALAAGGETWAFVGSALDQLDPSQARLLGPVLDGGGAFFSELPPGVRANTRTFPRRNRLISGASDAVLVLRAGTDSGALHTARYAKEQGRALWALPGDFDNEAAAGANRLIADGHARLCLGPRQLVEQVGARLDTCPAPAMGAEEPGVELSEEARAAYRLLRKSPQSFEDLHAASGGMEAASLLSALCELELFGFALQRPGKFYEKV